MRTFCLLFLSAILLPQIFVCSINGQDQPPRLTIEPEHAVNPPCRSSAVPDGQYLKGIVTSVFDRSSGRRVAGLTSADFLLTDSNREIDMIATEVPASPLSVVLLFDTSPSSAGQLRDMGRAATRFLSVLKPNDKLAMYTFDGVLSEVVPFNTVEKLGNRMMTIERIGAGTRLYDAVLRVMSSGALKGPGQKILVILTDGYDTLSNLANRDESLRLAFESDTFIYTFQIPKTNNYLRPQPNEYLQKLADLSGGRLVPVPSSLDATKGLMDVPSEVRGKYILCYLTSDKDAEPKLKLRVADRNRTLRYKIY